MKSLPWEVLRKRLWLEISYRGPFTPIASSFQTTLPELVPFSVQEAIMQLGMGEAL